MPSITNYPSHPPKVEAFNVFDALLNGDLTGLPSLFTNATGFHYYFNYLNTE